jgi:phosphatidylglycerophosphatase A
MSERLKFWISTAFGLGLSPILPGTCSALLGLILHLLILHILPEAAQFSVLVALFIIFSALCLYLSDWAEAYWKKPDYQSFVLDEVAGYLLVPILFRADNTLPYIIWGFILFRILDMIKIFPANRIDKQMKNRYGVLLDDFVSAIYAAVVLYIAWFIVG